MFVALLTLAASPFDPATWLAIEANNAHILALPPDASRNFQISLAYQDIGVQFSALLRANATMNWATMAKWASNTVGMGIRDQFLPHWVDELLAGWPAWVRQAAEKDADLLDRLLEPLLNVTSVALSGGNRAVFVAEQGGAREAGSDVRAERRGAIRVIIGRSDGRVGGLWRGANRCGQRWRWRSAATPQLRIGHFLGARLVVLRRDLIPR